MCWCFLMFSSLSSGVAVQVPGNKHKHTFVSPGSKCRWPQKATRIVLDLVKNAESNAEVNHRVLGCNQAVPVFMGHDGCQSLRR